MAGADLLLVPVAQMAARDGFSNQISSYCTQNGIGLALIVAKGEDEIAASAAATFSVVGQLRAPVAFEALRALIDQVQVGMSQARPGQNIEDAVA